MKDLIKVTVIRSWVGGIMALLAMGASGAYAESYPNKPITLIVQSAPGGSADLTGRVLGQKLSESMGTSVLVMNDPAAGGALAVQRVVRAKPDGYTLLMLGTKSAITAATSKQPGMDLMKDLTPVAVVSSSDLAVIVDSHSKYKKLADLVQDIKRRPGKVTIAVGDVTGGIQHLCAELFKSAVHGDFVVVPYGSNSKLSVAVRAGEVEAAIELLPPSMSQIKSGDIRALAVTARERFQDLPDVPTVAEAGYPGAEVVTYSVIAVPSRTPRPVIDVLNARINDALGQADLQQRSRLRGSRVPAPGTPEQAKEQLGREIAKWKEVVQHAQLNME